MRVLLTGASGQIGRAIAAALGGPGYEPIAMSRETRLGALDAVERIEEAIAPCDAIVHAAATLSHDLFDPSVCLVNCLGTQQILKLADRWRVSQLIYLSSVPVIGRPLQLPITEEHPAQPLTAYHASKLYGEHLMRLAETAGRRAVSLRITSPAGPGTPRNRILGVFVERAIAGEALQLAGRGGRRQNYVDVRDVAAAVEACLRRGASGTYHIAAAESVSNRELAVACIEELSSSATVQFTGRPDPEEDTVWDVSIVKAQRDLGFCPSFGIRDSIRALAHEYRNPQ